MNAAPSFVGKFSSFEAHCRHQLLTRAGTPLRKSTARVLHDRVSHFRFHARCCSPAPVQVDTGGNLQDLMGHPLESNTQVGTTAVDRTAPPPAPDFRSRGGCSSEFQLCLPACRRTVRTKPCQTPRMAHPSYSVDRSPLDAPDVGTNPHREASS
jgi:hypothetical protein